MSPETVLHRRKGSLHSSHQEADESMTITNNTNGRRVAKPQSPCKPHCMELSKCHRQQIPDSRGKGNTVVSLDAARLGDGSVLPREGRIHFHLHLQRIRLCPGNLVELREAGEAK